MKILMLACADSIHTVRWANAFSERGHEVVLVANNDHREKNDKFNKEIKKYYLPFSGRIGYYANSIFFRRIAKNESPNVINIHYASGYGTTGRIANIHPTVLNVWGSDVYRFPQKGSFYKKIILKNLTSADRIASTSRNMAKQIQALLGNDNADITITPFGVNVNTFRPIHKEESVGRSQFVFGVAKSLKAIYGIDTIIDAFSIVYAKWKNNKQGFLEPVLHIYGDGVERERLEHLVIKNNIDDSVVFKGAIPNEQMPAAINTMDVFCLASLSESFGVSAIEAMSCGVPVIASDADGFLEVIQNENTGLIFSKGNAEQLADAMWKLFVDNSYRNTLAENAREHVIRNYNWESNVSVLENLLISVSK